MLCDTGVIEGYCVQFFSLWGFVFRFERLASCCDGRRINGAVALGKRLSDRFLVLCIPCILQVRRIQNNVRGWILRKNYTNLREAAKVLQGAWREKKQHRSMPSQEISVAMLRTGASPTPPSASIGEKRGPGRLIVHTAGEVGPTPLGSASSHGSHGSHGKIGGMDHSSVPMDLQEPNHAQLMAAATLQAATRGMLARRSLAFSSVRKQTMASLVIQKSLVKWWEHSKAGGGVGAAVGVTSNRGSPLANAAAHSRNVGLVPSATGRVGSALAADTRAKPGSY
jgi:hypothetical protein